MGKAIVLQKRDWELLRGLLESRVMKAAHVAEIYFEGRREMTKKRLQKLKGAKLVTEGARLRAEAAILMLAPAGLGLLQTEGVLAEYPPLTLAAHLRRLRVSESKLRHELAVIDAIAEVFCAARESAELQIVEFSAWPQRVGGRWERQPDAAVYLREEGGRSRTLYIEADRSTEALSVLIGKVRDYAEDAEGANLLFSFKTEARRRSVEIELRRLFPALSISRDMPGLPLTSAFLYLRIAIDGTLARKFSEPNEIREISRPMLL